MDRHAIVFGGRSFLGRHIAQHLIDRGVGVTLPRAWNEGPHPLVESGAIDRVVDHDASASLVDALVGKNWVFWSLEPDPGADAEAEMATQVRAFRRLADAVREAGVDRIVATLPASICWEPGRAEIDESRRYTPGSASDARLDAYYATYQAHCYAAADGVDVVTLAPTLLVGDGARPLGISVPRDGREVDVCHVEEAARAHLCAAQHAAWGTLLLLGGHRVARSALPALIPAPRSRGLLGRGGSDPRSHFIDPGVLVDPSRAVEILGFEPSAGL